MGIALLLVSHGDALCVFIDRQKDVSQERTSRWTAQQANRDG